MAQATPKTTQVAATVTDIRPQAGIAYLTGADGSGWAVTGSTRGAGLDSLKPGQHVDLTVEHHSDFSVASGYAPLD